MESESRQFPKFPIFPTAHTEDELSEQDLSALLPLAYRLKFPKELERRFQSFYYQNSIFFIRTVLIAFLIGYGAFGVADFFNLPITRHFAWLIRYGFICPAFTAVIIFSFSRNFQRVMQVAITTVQLVGGLGIVMIAASAQPEEPGYRLYFMGFVFVILGIHFCRIRFIYASTIGWIIWLTYACIALFGQQMVHSDSGLIFVLGNLFYLGMMNFAGMLVGYLLEASARIDFLQRRALAYEKRKSESLLLNILPQSIVARLKQDPSTIAQEYAIASILFADIVNFTPLSSQLSPTELVNLLDEMFSHFDQLVEQYGLEKIKTIGDCYMVASGVPTPREDHAEALAHLALDMLHYLKNFAQQTGYPVNLRIGIHTGSVVAGVIGRKKFLYDLWGDTVNTASRMESHGEPGCVQISRTTYEYLAPHFICQSQGSIAIKGKGAMEVWHLIGRNPAPYPTLEREPPRS